MSRKARPCARLVVGEGGTRKVGAGQGRGVDRGVGAHSRLDSERVRCVPRVTRFRRSLWGGGRKAGSARHRVDSTDSDYSSARRGAARGGEWGRTWSMRWHVGVPASARAYSGEIERQARPATAFKKPRRHASFPPHAAWRGHAAFRTAWPFVLTFGEGRSRRDRRTTDDPADLFATASLDGDADVP